MTNLQNINENINSAYSQLQNSCQNSYENICQIGPYISGKWVAFAKGAPDLLQSPKLAKTVAAIVGISFFLALATSSTVALVICKLFLVSTVFLLAANILLLLAINTLVLLLLFGLILNQTKKTLQTSFESQ